MLTHLRLLNFRCFDAIHIGLPESGGIFIGDNAQGKTSILEAICVGMRLQSPRTHRFSQMIKIGSPGFGLAIGSSEHDWKVQYKPKKSPLLERDGETVTRSNDYLSSTKILVWMANDDLQLVRGAGEYRRHFLDFMGAQLHLDYRIALNKYKRALKARNVLLKSATLRWEEIDAYTQILIRNGELIAKHRRALVESLNAVAARVHRDVSCSEESLQLRYLRSGGEDLATSFEQAKEKEKAFRQTVIGPHRDDVELTLNGLTAREFASEGQQRTLAVSMKVAQGELLERLSAKQPIYLIDDVFGELDATRRNALMAVLPRNSQRLITTTSVDWLKNETALPCFSVRKAVVSAL